MYSFRETRNLPKITLTNFYTPKYYMQTTTYAVKTSPLWAIATHLYVQITWLHYRLQNAK